MSYYGDIRLGDTIDIKFTTRQISGAPFTLGGTPVVSAYPSNSTTQLTAGITLSVDFDTVTGLNNVNVVATSGNGYATATNYALVITTGTVNSVSVAGEVIGSFSIEARSALMPTTAARTLVVDAAGLADANAVKLGPSGSGTAQTARDVGASVLLSAGTGTGQLNFTSGVVKANLAQILGTALTETTGQIAAAFKKFFNVATPTSTMDALALVAVASSVTGLTPSNLDTTVSSRLASASYTAPDNTTITAIDAKTTNLPSDPADESLIIAATDAIMARLGSPAGVSVSADVAAVKVDTAAVKTQTDKLTFTVANKLDSNTLAINSVTIVGDGSLTPFNV